MFDQNNIIINKNGKRNIRNEFRLPFFIWFYTKHHLKFIKNQADNLAAVFNRFILDFGADFFLYLLVFRKKLIKAKRSFLPF